MKIKDLIRLIVLVLVIAFVAVWAFSGMTVFTAKFVRWDKSAGKSSELGTKYVAVYSLSDPNAEAEEATEEADEAAKTESTFDEDAAVKKAVEVYEKRLDTLGYAGAKVNRMGKNKVRIELPGSSSTSGLEDFLENNGALEIKNGEDVVFTNADVKSAKVLGYDQEDQLYYAELTLTPEAKERLLNLTSNGEYKLDLTMDTDAVTADITGSTAIKNGKLKVGFTATTSEYINAITLAYCVDSGVIDGKITVEADMGMITTADAGPDVIGILAIALLAIFVACAVYFIVAHRGMGIAAVLCTLVSVLLLDFFASTFTWFQLSPAGLLGIAVALLISVLTLALVLSSISGQYASGKSVSDSIESGVSNLKGLLLELLGVGAVLGIGLWICGGELRNFGVAVLAGCIVAAFTGLLLLKHIIKILMGVGLSSAKSLGLKKGE